MIEVEAFNNFPKQFEYEPIIENADKLQQSDNFIVLGMGGSHLAADLLKIVKESKNLFMVHSDYSLPNLPEKILDESLIITSSYSGNTEEVIDGFNVALSRNLNLAVITTGGKLLELAKNNQVPFIQIPDTGIESRGAVGFFAKALLKIIEDEENLKKISELSKSIDINLINRKANELAEKIKGHIPVIYSSAKNKSLARNWKIRFNEGGKIPTFYNVFPELNHNEIAGFDWNENNKRLSDKYCFILLKDISDNPRIIRRMEILEKLYKDKGYLVINIMIEGNNVFEKIFFSVFLADLTSYYIALSYNSEPFKTPIIENFKKLLNQ